MRELPGGTVTFLFTDIAGSTKLLHEHGAGYADPLAEHRRILRDAFFVAFERASDALARRRSASRLV